MEHWEKVYGTNHQDMYIIIDDVAYYEKILT